MLLVPWLIVVMFVLKIWLVTMVLMLLLIWGGKGSRMLSSMLVVTFFGFVVFGTPSFSIFKNSWLLFLVLRLTMMVLVALLQMPWFGTKVVLSRPVPPPFVLSLIMLLFLVLLVLE